MKKILKGGPVAVLLLTLTAFCSVNSTEAFARPHAGHFKHANAQRHHAHRSPHYFRRLPAGYFTLRLADALYYYYAGLYYRQTPSGYVVVSPPAGSVVTTLPSGYRTIISDGNTYYYYNNGYYVQQGQKFVVTSPPPKVLISNPSATEAPEKTVVVNVPNPNGSFMPITLQKYSDGYVGPNGEFYPDYPGIEQLKAMYAKQSASAEAAVDAEEVGYEIPNANGSFTRVTIYRSDEGYVGPEGEYYPQRPTVEQLAEMYAKG